MIASLLMSLAIAAGPAGAREAKELARRAVIEYDAGDFEKALADVQRAYELDSRPGLLFNLAQCHRALHHWERAEFFYRGYLRNQAHAPNRTQVLALIAEMQAKKKEADAAAAPAPILVEAPAGSRQLPSSPTAGSGGVPSPAGAKEGRGGAAAPAAAVTAPPPRRPVPAGAWAVGGVGLAAIATGVVFAVLATNLQGADRYQQGLTPYHTITQGQFQSQTTDAYLANGFVYGGAAALVGAVLWGLLGRGVAQPQPSQPAAGGF